MLIRKKEAVAKKVGTGGGGGGLVKLKAIANKVSIEACLFVIIIDPLNHEKNNSFILLWPTITWIEKIMIIKIFKN